MSENIKDILRKSPLFRHLSESEIESLTQEAVQKQYAAKELLMKEGDLGDVLYVILNGTARVFTFNLLQNEVELTRLQKGDYIGEQALLTKTPMHRNSSVQAMTPLNTATFSHETLQRCLQMDSSLKQLLQEHGQRQLITKFTKQLKDESTHSQELSMLFEEFKYFRPNEIIFQNNDEPDCAYLLLSGSVEVQIEDNNNQVILRSLIQSGQLFGEQAVLKKTTRAGTALALNEVKTIAINAETLRSLTEKNINIRDTLNQLMKAYELPAVGVMTRYQNFFLNMPALETHILKPNGDQLIVSIVPKAQIQAVSFVIKDDSSNAMSYHFEANKNQAREIQLIDNHLVSVISVGKWDDLNKWYRLVEAKITITPERLTRFNQTGEIDVEVSNDNIGILI